jgi:DNA-binding NtrC family response regulator
LLFSLAEMVKPRAVLVVDDDVAMREMLASALEEEGVEVTLAAGVDEASEAARTTHFDAILSDICMPDKDGFQLLRELRQIQPGTPVILMTAFGGSESVAHAMHQGAFDYLMKPFSREALRAALEWAFAESHGPRTTADSAPVDEPTKLP